MSMGVVKDLVFPARCPVCGMQIGFEKRLLIYEGRASWGSYVHRECFEKLPFVTGNFCGRCGTAVVPGEKLCSVCSSGGRAFEEGRAVFLYEDPARTAALKLKYSAKKEYGDFFAFAAVKVLGEWIRKTGADCIIPVPVHRERYRERGYNQAEVIAEGISAKTGIPVRTDVLKREKNTRAQKELTAVERKINLIRAFEIAKPLQNNETVLLVDDIFTTGTTSEACSWLLKTRGGAGRVYVLCICTGKDVKLKKAADISGGKPENISADTPVNNKKA